MAKIQDEILEKRYDYVAREGINPNELHITQEKWNELEEVVKETGFYSKIYLNPKKKVEDLWYWGMKIFKDAESFFMNWTEETESIKLSFIKDLVLDG